MKSQVPYLADSPLHDPTPTYLLLFIQKKLKVKYVSDTVESIQFSSVAHSCPTLRDPVDRSTLGLPVHNQLQEFTQTHVH